MKGLILTYLVAVVGSIGALGYPLLGLMVYVGFAVLRPHFLFGWAGDITGVSFYVGIFTLIGWVIHGFGTWKLGRGRLAVGMLFLFVAWFAFSAVFALNPVRAWGSFSNLLKFIVPLLVGISLLNSVGERRRMFWTLVLCMGYVGFEMNLNYLLKGFNEAAEGFGGMDNNCFGAALACMIGPAVSLAIVSRTWVERIAASVSGLLILHTALLTFSRGTMVGLLAVGAVAFVMMPKKPKNMFALLVVLIIAIRLTGPQLLARYSTTFAGEEERDASAESRVDLWKDCLKVVAQYPILGVGPANWRDIAAQYGWPPGKSAHSVWMETAAELGIPGSLFLLLFFVLPALRLWPIAREKITDDNREDVAIAIGTVLSIVGFVVAAQFVSVSGLEAPYYVVMVGVALLKNRTKPLRVATWSPVVTPRPELAPAISPLPEAVWTPSSVQPPRPLPGNRPPILDLGGRRRSPSNG